MKNSLSESEISIGFIWNIMYMINGIYTISIAKEYQQTGRTFAVIGIDKCGKTLVFADTDTNPSIITFSNSLK